MLKLSRVLPWRRAGTRVYGAFHDPLDQATGLEKRELLAHLAGDCDPFRILSFKRVYYMNIEYYRKKQIAVCGPIIFEEFRRFTKKGPGTKERPNLVPSAFHQRLVGCKCTPDTYHIEWMWLHASEPKRCACGYWFELCPIAPIVV